jgi:hypothetical protein
MECTQSHFLQKKFMHTITQSTTNVVSDMRIALEALDMPKSIFLLNLVLAGLGVLLGS